MRELLNHLRTHLNQICPSYLQTLSHVSYPHITLEPGQILQGLPWGPRIVLIDIKIWSRYAGVKEILSLAKGVDTLLSNYVPLTFDVSIKTLDSTLTLLPDEQTRVHTFRLKARLPGDIS